MTSPNRNRTVIVTGAYPPDVCGVGDYTERLMAAAPPFWELFVERDWSWRAAPGIVRRLLSRRPTTVIIQYPTQGYGWSLVPHMLILIGHMTGRYRAVLALHEFTSLSRKAQLALAFATFATDHVIFTTEVERDRARASRFFSSRVPTSVIGILSNIPYFTEVSDFGSRSIDVAYFGHIRPNKGLEDFLDVMAEVRKTEPLLRIAVIGEIPKCYHQFGEMVTARCDALGAEVVLGLDDDAVGHQLADVRILYLPFRDGVSARRGSVLAGFGAGAIVATRIGDATPEKLRQVVIECTGAHDDAAILRQAVRFSDAHAAKLQQAGRHYVATMLPRDWAHVAEMYDKAVAAADS